MELRHWFLGNPSKWSHHLHWDNVIFHLYFTRTDLGNWPVCKLEDSLFCESSSFLVLPSFQFKFNTEILLFIKFSPLSQLLVVKSSQLQSRESESERQACNISSRPNIVKICVKNWCSYQARDFLCRHVNRTRNEAADYGLINIIKDGTV